MGQFDAARSEQMDILQEKNLEVQGKELEEANQRYTSVHYPQSLGEYVDSDSEEPEMDPEEEPEEDPEEEPEEDPEDEPEEDPEEELEKEPEEDPEEEPGEDLEMDGNLCHEKVDVESAAPLNLSSEIFSAKQLTEHENEEPSAECVFKPNPETETNRSYQNSSDVKQRRVVNAAVRPSISQSYGLEMNCKYDEASEQEFNIEYAAIDSGQLEEAVVGNENSVEQANPGKRRCSKWDQGPKEDKKEVIEERKCKKGKTVWDANDSKSAVQEPVQLTDVRNRVCGPLLDLEVQSLIKRFSEISSLLDPLVDDKLEKGAYTFDKLIKEREKIFLELAKRNAIISKELYVPVKEYPTYNFIGLILGPKGNTQKRMELKSGCRIRLRGKDSSKSAQEADPSEDEELNVYIEAVSQKSLDAAVCMVKKLLISVEDEMNDQKRAHLAELFNLKAATLFSSCSVCKERGHNQLACPQKKATVMATSDTCKSFSHPSSGCPVTPSNLKFKSSGEIDAANLYIGFLPQTMDDSRLRDLFSPFGTITHLRVTLDMKTGYCKGHGFVRFDTPSAASLAIMHMNGYQIDGHRLRVKIAGAPPATGQPATSLLPVCSNSGPATVAASYSASPHEMMPKSEVSLLNDEGIGVTSSLNKESSYKIYQTEVPTIPQKALGCNLYVGYLPQTIDDSHLRDLFSPFGTINQVRVALDMGTGYSKGYGFVRFDTPSAASLAIMHMNGYEIDGHRLTVKIAGDPPATGQQATSLLPVNPNPGPETVASSYSASPHYMMPKGKMSVLNAEGIGVPSSLNMESSYEISQTEAPTIPQKVSGSNLFVGYLPLTVDESGLWELFSPFGTIIQLRVPLDRGTGYSKGYGFVRFDTPSAASLALMHLNGYEIDGHRLKVSIAGDPPATRQPAASLLPVNPLPGPATVATSCPALPDGMMFNSERLCYPSSQDIKYSTSLYVGYLPQTIDDSCLRELFSPFGTVTQSSVMLDMRTGYSKGYGFVTFDTPSAASIAMIHMNGYEIDGHRLAVSMRTVGAAPPTEPPATSGFPLYSIPQHTAVATSCPALPSYMMPNFSQNMESKNEKEAPIVSHEVPGSTGSNSPLPSTAFVLRSTESGTASSSAGSRTALSSIGLAAASSESRSVISSYSFSSLFRGDHDNLGSKS